MRGVKMNGKKRESWFKYLISIAFAFEEETKALEHLLF